jgi:hypothetical protein
MMQAVQQSEVAAIVTTRHAAEQTALQFYRKPGIRDREGAHRPLIGVS